MNLPAPQQLADLCPRVPGDQKLARGDVAPLLRGSRGNSCGTFWVEGTHFVPHGCTGAGEADGAAEYFH